MGVKILTGRAGRLAPLMLREIAQARQAGKRVLVLVPEQFTLLMEREIMDGLHLPGLMDVEVLSPSRLRRNVFERGGCPPQGVLDGRGRAMALSRALLGAAGSAPILSGGGGHFRPAGTAGRAPGGHEKGGPYGGTPGGACPEPASRRGPGQGKRPKPPVGGL